MDKVKNFGEFLNEEYIGRKGSIGFDYTNRFSEKFDIELIYAVGFNDKVLEIIMNFGKDLDISDLDISLEGTQKNVIHIQFKSHDDKEALSIVNEFSEHIEKIGGVKPIEIYFNNLCVYKDKEFIDKQKSLGDMLKNMFSGEIPSPQNKEKGGIKYDPNTTNFTY